MSCPSRLSLRACVALRLAPSRNLVRVRAEPAVPRSLSRGHLSAIFSRRLDFGWAQVLARAPLTPAHSLAEPRGLETCRSVACRSVPVPAICALFGLSERAALASDNCTNTTGIDSFNYLLYLVLCAGSERKFRLALLKVAAFRRVSKIVRVQKKCKPSSSLGKSSQARFFFLTQNAQRDPIQSATRAPEVGIASLVRGIGRDFRREPCAPSAPAHRRRRPKGECFAQLPLVCAPSSSAVVGLEAFVVIPPPSRPLRQQPETSLPAPAEGLDPTRPMA